MSMIIWVIIKGMVVSSVMYTGYCFNFKTINFGSNNINLKFIVYFYSLNQISTEMTGFY